jgi:hypothetical protein
MQGRVIYDDRGARLSIMARAKCFGDARRIERHQVEAAARAGTPGAGWLRSDRDVAGGGVARVVRKQRDPTSGFSRVGPGRAAMQPDDMLIQRAALALAHLMTASDDEEMNNLDRETIRRCAATAVGERDFRRHCHVDE